MIYRQPTRKLVSKILVLLLTFAAPIVWFRFFDDPYPDRRIVRYSFTVRNVTSAALPEAEITIYGPVKQTSWQRAGQITASHRFELVPDELANQQLRFRFEDFPPHGAKVINVTAEVMTAKHAQTMWFVDESGYLREEPYLEISDQRIKAIALQQQGGTPLETAENLYQWLGRSMTYAGYVKEDRGALYAALHRQGDCTEFAYLYTALARASNIPSRVMGGFVVAESTVLRPQEFHNWSEILLERKWMLSDAQKMQFLGRGDHYIAFRILTGQNAATLNSHGMAMASSGLRITMN